MKEKRAQISIEYMIVVGFTTLVLASLISLAYFYSSETKNEININQIDKAARKIIDKSTTVYYAGSPAKTTLDITFPAGIKSITINPNELIFIVEVHGIDNTLAYTSKATIQGAISESAGLKHIVIEAKDGYVQISG